MRSCLPSNTLMFQRRLCRKNIVGNSCPYYTKITNLVRNERQKAASTLPWAVLMVQKSASLSEHILFLLSNKLGKQSTALHMVNELVLLK